MCEKMQKVNGARAVCPSLVDAWSCRAFPQVNRWLAATLGDEAVPQFEVTARTVDILEQLAQSSESRCRHARLLAEDRRQKAAEYQADGEAKATTVAPPISVGQARNSSDLSFKSLLI